MSFPRAEPAGIIVVINRIIEYQLSRLTSPTCQTCQTQRASDQAAPSHMAVADKSGAAILRFFLKKDGGVGEGILRCQRSAFSREKKFFPSPISQRFANKKRRGGGSFGEKLWRRLRRGVGQCQQSFLITLLNISQKLNFSRAAIEKY